MSADEPGQNVFEVDGRVGAVQFAALDEGGQDGPVLGAFVGAGEERILAVEGDGPHGPFDRVGVEFDAAIVEEAGQPVPARLDVADRLGGHRAAGQAPQLLIEE